MRPETAQMIRELERMIERNDPKEREDWNDRFRKSAQRRKPSPKPIPNPKSPTKH